MNPSLSRQFSLQTLFSYLFFTSAQSSLTGCLLETIVELRFGDLRMIEQVYAALKLTEWVLDEISLCNSLRFKKRT
ncbi:hypothetical protein BT93_A1906 [Corymbia citriodora subsp. variegata]|nr:hypothetical protein BT93_A1906 [Corymbia citriodora subsp. variegata]